MSLSLEHDRLKSDLAGAAAALGVSVSKVESMNASVSGRSARERRLTLQLPRPTGIKARFVREGLIERAKKWLVDEIEVGSALFDDAIYVVTSTRKATARLLEQSRVQQALLLLVDDTRFVQIDGDQLRIIDDDAPDDGKDATAEALAIAAHLLGA